MCGVTLFTKKMNEVGSGKKLPQKKRDAAVCDHDHRVSDFQRKKSDNHSAIPWN